VADIHEDDGGLPCAGLTRRVRRISDMSQRQLAEAVNVSRSSISKVEAGALAPTIRLMQRILAVAELRLVAVDRDGHLELPMEDWQDIEDGGGRRYPSHLDTIVDPRVGEWWADQYGLARPPETFRRDRAVRDAERRRSQWEVRVAKYRFDPPPPNPAAARWRDA
jgi:DNA-binding XRE family transcriptional regulator